MNHRVVVTERFRRAFPNSRKRYGTVEGFGWKFYDVVRIRPDECKTISAFHMDFWDPVLEPAEKEEL
jgi:hypothetical protein